MSRHKPEAGRPIDPTTGGALRLSDGMIWLMTPCCGASAKGMEWGIGCRACYNEVDDALGMAWGEGAFPLEFSDWAGCTIAQAVAARTWLREHDGAQVLPTTNPTEA